MKVFLDWLIIEKEAGFYPVNIIKLLKAED